MAVAANALTSLTTAKDHLGITDASQDTRVERWIDTASQMIEKATDRVLYSKSHTEVQDGRGSKSILLRQYPVTAITSLHIDSQGTFDANSLIAAADYAQRDEDELVLRSSTFKRGLQNIQIVYTAGFSTIPADLENACLELIEFMYDRRGDRRVGVASKSKRDENITFITKIPEFIMQMIEPYIRVEFAAANVPVENT
ncbi:MAG: phage head-tail connector protein [Candidatus Paceibacterota bacterium]